MSDSEESVKRFNDHVDLFEKDPVAFEAYRIRALEENIEKMIERGSTEESIANCRRSLWRMQTALSKHNNPICRFNAMVALFFEQNDRFTDALRMLSDAKARTKHTQTSAKVIQFTKTNK